MKNLVFMAGLFIGMIMSAQEKTHDNFIIIDNKVVWKKTFDSELKIDSLRSLLTKHILWNENPDKYNLVDGNIILSISKKEIGRAYPLDYTAKVYFKDNQYKVVITYIAFNREDNSISGYSFGNELIESILLKSKNTKWKTTNYANKMTNTLNDTFLASYELTNNDNNW